MTWSFSQLVAGRSKYDKLAEKIFGIYQTPARTGYYVPPSAFLPKFMSAGFHPVVIQSFDANKILNKASTMVAHRLIPKETYCEKAQSPKNVFTTCRVEGSDDTDILDSVRLIFQDMEKLRQNGIMIDGKICKVTGEIFSFLFHSFLFPFLSLKSLQMK